ncbi:MAG: 16S rRNA (adenine(1518)-N(6)/adenine(1519)-N(6))-dimethyltransferase, partial [Betaproteobacteria bacterium]|nr:16S rRNA (adenine(1518)-N(6)/adenine(1519)-N(6))-dimethyltransferase [Betaproteobacteria bacterium]
KKIRSSLKTILTESKLEELGLDPHSRAEELSPEDFYKIAEMSL